MGMKTPNNTPESATPQNGDPPINWHPAFYEAIRLELDEYKDVLSFHMEYQLNKAPLKMDILIIKKDKDAVIGKNIASFRAFIDDRHIFTQIVRGGYRILRPGYADDLRYFDKI
jgi:hypothetical protein